MEARNESFGFYLSANKIVFYCYWNTVCNEIARCYNGEITIEDNVVIKHCYLNSLGSSRVRWRHSHWRNSPESAWIHIQNDAYGTTDSYLVAVITNPPERLTKSPFVQDLIYILQSERWSYASWSMWRRPS